MVGSAGRNRNPSPSSKKHSHQTRYVSDAHIRTDEDKERGRCETHSKADRVRSTDFSAMRLVYDGFGNVFGYSQTQEYIYKYTGTATQRCFVQAKILYPVFRCLIYILSFRQCKKSTLKCAIFSFFFVYIPSKTAIDRATWPCIKLTVRPALCTE